MKYLIYILLFAGAFTSMSQVSERELTYDAFIEQVMQHHPGAYRASIIVETGNSTVLSARGQFDPKLIGDINQKYFKDDQYYSRAQGGIKIPTWFGVSAEAGYTLNEGIYLNPENRMPNAGLWYAGLRLELGQGLIIDQRRAEFEKAKVFRQGTALEQRVLLNELKRDASIAYWKWNQSYQKMRVYEDALENARIRFEGVKDAAEFGDRPYIDTVEAYIVVQNRTISLSQVELDYKNAELQLEIYLWDQGFIPLELNGLIPSGGQINLNYSTPSLIDSLTKNHPYLQLNDLKLQQKQIDLQLKKELLKPQLTLKYNAISEPVGNNPLAQYSPSNYTWGASFAYPILSRKERGNVQLAKLKIQDQKLANTVLEAEVGYKINSALNSYFQSVNQYSISQQLVVNSELLYEAEKELFDTGESSVFMINSRESKFLKTKIELIETENYVQMLKSELDYTLMIP